MSEEINYDSIGVYEVVKDGLLNEGKMQKLINRITKQLIELQDGKSFFIALDKGISIQQGESQVHENVRGFYFEKREDGYRISPIGCNGSDFTVTDDDYFSFSSPRDVYEIVKRLVPIITYRISDVDGKISHEPNISSVAITPVASTSEIETPSTSGSRTIRKIDEVIGHLPVEKAETGEIATKPPLRLITPLFKESKKQVSGFDCEIDMRRPVDWLSHKLIFTISEPVDDFHIILDKDSDVGGVSVSSFVIQKRYDSSNKKITYTICRPKDGTGEAGAKVYTFTSTGSERCDANEIIDRIKLMSSSLRINVSLIEVAPVGGKNFRDIVGNARKKSYNRTQKMQTIKVKDEEEDIPIFKLQYDKHRDIFTQQLADKLEGKLQEIIAGDSGTQRGFYIAIDKIIDVKSRKSLEGIDKSARGFLITKTDGIISVFSVDEHGIPIRAESVGDDKLNPKPNFFAFNTKCDNVFTIAKRITKAIADFGGELIIETEKSGISVAIADKTSSFLEILADKEHFPAEDRTGKGLTHTLFDPIITPIIKIETKENVKNILSQILKESITDSIDDICIMFNNKLSDGIRGVVVRKELGGGCTIYPIDGSGQVVKGSAILKEKSISVASVNDTAQEIVDFIAKVEKDIFPIILTSKDCFEETVKINDAAKIDIQSREGKSELTGLLENRLLKNGLDDNANQQFFCIAVNGDISIENKRVTHNNIRGFYIYHNRTSHICYIYPIDKSGKIMNNDILYKIDYKENVQEVAEQIVEKLLVLKNCVTDELISRATIMSPNSGIIIGVLESIFPVREIGIVSETQELSEHSSQNTDDERKKQAEADERRRLEEAQNKNKEQFLRYYQPLIDYIASGEIKVGDDGASKTIDDMVVDFENETFSFDGSNGILTENIINMINGSAENATRIIEILKKSEFFYTHLFNYIYPLSSPEEQGALNDRTQRFVDILIQTDENVMAKLIQHHLHVNSDTKLPLPLIAYLSKSENRTALDKVISYAKEKNSLRKLKQSLPSVSDFTDKIITDGIHVLNKIFFQEISKEPQQLTEGNREIVLTNWLESLENNSGDLFIALDGTVSTKIESGESKDIGGFIITKRSNDFFHGYTIESVSNSGKANSGFFDGFVISEARDGKNRKEIAKRILGAIGKLKDEVSGKPISPVAVAVHGNNTEFVKQVLENAKSAEAKAKTDKIITEPQDFSIEYSVVPEGEIIVLNNSNAINELKKVLEKALLIDDKFSIIIDEPININVTIDYEEGSVTSINGTNDKKVFKGVRGFRIEKLNDMYRVYMIDEYGKICNGGTEALPVILFEIPEKDSMHENATNILNKINELKVREQNFSPALITSATPGSILAIERKKIEEEKERDRQKAEEDKKRIEDEVRQRAEYEKKKIEDDLRRQAEYEIKSKREAREKANKFKSRLLQNLNDLSADGNGFCIELYERCLLNESFELVTPTINEVGLKTDPGERVGYKAVKKFFVRKLTVSGEENKYRYVLYPMNEYDICYREHENNSPLGFFSIDAENDTTTDKIAEEILDKIISFTTLETANYPVDIPKSLYDPTEEDKEKLIYELSDSGNFHPTLIRYIVTGRHYFEPASTASRANRQEYYYTQDQDCFRGCKFPVESFVRIIKNSDGLKIEKDINKRIIETLMVSQTFYENLFSTDNSNPDEQNIKKFVDALKEAEPDNAKNIVLNIIKKRYCLNGFAESLNGFTESDKCIFKKLSDPLIAYLSKDKEELNKLIDYARGRGALMSLKDALNPSPEWKKYGRKGGIKLPSTETIKSLAELEKTILYEIAKETKEEREKAGHLNISDFEHLSTIEAIEKRLKEMTEKEIERLSNSGVGDWYTDKLKNEFLGLTYVGVDQEVNLDYIVENPAILRSKFNLWKEKVAKLTRTEWDLKKYRDTRGRGETETSGRFKYEATEVGVENGLTDEEKAEYIKMKIRKHRGRYIFNPPSNKITKLTPEIGKRTAENKSINEVGVDSQSKKIDRVISNIKSGIESIKPETILLTPPRINKETVSDDDPIARKLIETASAVVSLNNEIKKSGLQQPESVESPVIPTSPSTPDTSEVIGVRDEAKGLIAKIRKEAMELTQQMEIINKESVTNIETMRKAEKEIVGLVENNIEADLIPTVKRMSERLKERGEKEITQLSIGGAKLFFKKRKDGGNVSIVDAVTILVKDDIKVSKEGEGKASKLDIVVGSFYDKNKGTQLFIDTLQNEFTKRKMKDGGVTDERNYYIKKIKEILYYINDIANHNEEITSLREVSNFEIKDGDIVYVGQKERERRRNSHEIAL